MNVPSYEFLGFAACVAILLNAWSSSRWRSIVLLAANLFFLATFAPLGVALVPFLSFVVAGFVFVRGLQLRPSRPLFIAALVWIVVAFCWLKRYAFVPVGLDLRFLYVTVGMSYVFFRMLHLAIDAFQGALPVRVSALSYANYTLNFTSLVSGPIQLYGDYHRSEDGRAFPPEARAWWEAARRIVLGYFKVAIVSAYLGGVQDRLLADLDAASPLLARSAEITAIVAIFPVYLYANFSGYTDFVIGVARFLRIELPENFRHPFGSFGFIEFWSRWHITLSNWLKTYVYSPLLIALLRRVPARAAEPYLGVFAYFVTFFLVGVWHGQSAMFLFFGILQGFGVAVNKLYQILMIRRIGRAAYRRLNARPSYAAVSRGFTIAWFAFTLIWFWASWPQVERLRTIAGAAGSVTAVLMLVTFATILLWLVAASGDALRRSTATEWFSRARPYARTAWYAALTVIIVSSSVIMNSPAPRIVYKGF